jgi:hypothetical protein
VRQWAQGLLFLLLAAALATALPALEPEVQAQAKMDWSQGALELDASLPVQGELSPDVRFVYERQVDQMLPSLFSQAVAQVTLDSHRSLGDRFRESPGLLQSLSDLALARGRKELSRLDQELKQVQVSYRFPFYGEGGLIGPLVLHSVPYPLPRLLGFVPTRAFSGLVIYAKGELPAHGKDESERLRPALFPRLYDEDMNLVLNEEMCDPAYLRQWGMVAYSYDQDEGPFLERIRVAPLRTVARGVFGIRATDIILSRETARQLLSSEENRSLLRQGRILVIIDQE